MDGRRVVMVGVRWKRVDLTPTLSARGLPVGGSESFRGAMSMVDGSRWSTGSQFPFRVWPIKLVHGAGVRILAEFESVTMGIELTRRGKPSK